jgi:hypothetical protein
VIWGSAAKGGARRIHLGSFGGRRPRDGPGRNTVEATLPQRDRGRDRSWYYNQPTERKEEGRFSPDMDASRSRDARLFP